MKKTRITLVAALLLLLVFTMLSAALAGSDNPFAGMSVYYEGQYKVGRDLPPESMFS